MNPIITFIIPVRHQNNAVDWAGLCNRLKQTIHSIASQSCKNWRAVVVANEGADLPEMPEGFSVTRVNFPPNALYDISTADREKVYDSFRWDKGRRILAGMLSARETDYFMIVDDDDFVSARLTAFVTDHRGANGWKIARGWVWNEGGKLAIQHNDFSNYCGTSLIIRSDLYRLPAHAEDASEDYIKTMLGSHIRIASILADQGTPIATLPFRGAIYRVGHSGAHSKSQNLLKSQVFNLGLLRHPKRILQNLSRFRFVDKAMRDEFFGIK